MRRGFKTLGFCMVLMVTLGGGTPAWAWGCRGHQIVALIALAHLTPAARAEVDAILAADPRSPGRGRFCSATGLPRLAAAANWPDAVRNGTTAAEHYVDLPLGARRSAAAFAQACPGRCVTWAIAHYAAQLVNSGRPAERGKALRYLEHLIGDVHQPLHDEDDDDKGGNQVEVYLPGSGRETTLHAAWDTGLLSLMPGASDPASRARQIEREFGSRRVPGASDPVDWAWASHDLAVRYAYAGLPRGGGQLDPAYIVRAQTVIASQLDLAGLRLARVLNQLLSR